MKKLDKVQIEYIIGSAIGTCFSMSDRKTILSVLDSIFINRFEIIGAYESMIPKIEKEMRQEEVEG